MAKAYLVHEHYDYYDHSVGHETTGSRFPSSFPVYRNKTDAEVFVEEMTEREVAEGYKVYVSETEKRNKDLQRKRVALDAAKSTGNKDLIRSVEFLDIGDTPVVGLDEYRETQHIANVRYSLEERELA